MLNEKMKPSLLAVLAIVAASLLVVMACGGEAESPVGGPQLSPIAQEGEAVYSRTCVLCHGAGAMGSDTGPPLIHRLYNPGHHPDISFRNAVRDGVIAHHWEFGHMPAQPNVSDEDVEKIICYIRELQIAGGIYEGDAPC